MPAIHTEPPISKSFRAMQKRIKNMKFVLLGTVDKNPIIVGTFPTKMAADVAVASLAITHPEYGKWKIVELVGVRELRRPKNLRSLERTVSYSFEGLATQ